MDTDELPRGRDAVVVAALVAGRTYAEAAAVADCSTGTVRRTRQRWADHITAERSELAEQAAAAMLALVPEAVAAYTALVRSPAPGVRLAAARDVMSGTLRWMDSTAFDRRLTALEQQTEPACPGPRGVA